MGILDFITDIGGGGSPASNDRRIRRGDNEPPTVDSDDPGSGGKQRYERRNNDSDKAISVRDNVPSEESGATVDTDKKSRGSIRSGYEQSDDPEPRDSRGRIPNKLKQYSSFSTITTLASLSGAELADPDNTYRKNGPQTVVLRSGGTGTQQVRTSYERDLGITAEYFIDDIEIESILSPGPLVRQTNSTIIRFKIYEPYSMGLFLETLKNSVKESSGAVPVDYTTQPYLLMLEFIGYDSEGNRLNTGIKRYIPIRFDNVEFDVTAGGSVYECSAYAYTDYAFSDEIQRIPEDVKLNGTDVAEVLQKGNRSLTTILNDKQLELKEGKSKKAADVFIISFPNQESSSGKSESDNANNSATTQGESNTVTVASDAAVEAEALEKKAEASFNAIGKSVLRDSVYDSGQNETKDSENADEADDQNEGDSQSMVIEYKKGTKIVDIIEDIALHSEYGKKMSSLDPDTRGMIPFWRIEAEVYQIQNEENVKQRGTFAKIFHFKVLEYKVHSSRLTSTTQSAPGFDIIRDNIPKEYNYIYSGKNDDIIDFNLRFNSAFFMGSQYDRFLGNQDQQSDANASGESEETVTPQNAEPSNGDSDDTIRTKETGGDDTSLNAGNFSNDPLTRISQQITEVITNGVDLIEAEMDILGDPYYIADSGLGNYSSERTGSQTTSDGTIDYQYEETSLILNFKTPIDIDPDSGEYIFQGQGTAPVRRFSGVYRINTITNSISGNKFTQKLSMHRMRNQEGAPTELTKFVTEDGGESDVVAINYNGPGRRGNTV